MEIDSAHGGVIKLDNITLTIGAECLAQDTNITIKYCQNFSFKTHLDLGLVYAAPRVYEFSPNGLKFVKPADLTFKVGNDTSGCEPYILHGFRNPENQRIVWELVTDGVEVNNARKFVNVKINSFSFFTYILSKRGKLARLMSHLTRRFTCRAYVFYRRLLPMETIDISVVLVSKFVDEKKEEIEQLKHHLEGGYIEGEKGKLMGVDTHCNLEMRLDFPGIESPGYLFKVDLSQLDSVGFVVDHFEGTALVNTASGSVKIYESNRNENKLLWKLKVHEQTKGETVWNNLESTSFPQPTRPIFVSAYADILLSSACCKCNCNCKCNF